MAERLVVNIKNGGAVDWLVLDEHNNRIGAIQADTLDGLARHAAGRRVVVLVPGEAVTLLSATLPSQNAQKVAQALPYALEERLAGDVDALHFAAGPPRADGSRGVAVVAHAVMADWLAELGAADLKADVLLPDIFALPASPERWHVAVEAERVLVRSGEFAGFAIDRAIADTLVALKLQQLGAADRPEVVIHAADPTAADVAALADACVAAGATVAEIGELPGETALSTASAGLAASAGFNLLQGAYRPRRDWEKRWRRWRTAAVLAAVWVIVAAAWQGVDYYRLHTQEQQLKQSIVALFHQAMPNSHRMVNPQAQMASRVDELQGAGGMPENGLLSMLAALGKGLGSTATTTLKTLDYHNGALDLQLTTPNVQVLDDLRGHLAQATGMNVAIESANAAGKTVDGRLRVGGAP